MNRNVFGQINIIADTHYADSLRISTVKMACVCSVHMCARLQTSINIPHPLSLPPPPSSSFSRLKKNSVSLLRHCTILAHSPSECLCGPVYIIKTSLWSFVFWLPSKCSLFLSVGERVCVCVSMGVCVCVRDGTCECLCGLSACEWLISFLTFFLRWRKI